MLLYLCNMLLLLGIRRNFSTIGNEDFFNISVAFFSSLCQIWKIVCSNIFVSLLCVKQRSIAAIINIIDIGATANQKLYQLNITLLSSNVKVEPAEPIIFINMCSLFD